MRYGHSRAPSEAESLVDLLCWRAQVQPDQVGFTFLTDGGAGQATLTYADLDRRARAVAAQIQRMDVGGSRALLLYPPGLEYISAFFGCLYAGLVAVPAYPPNPARLNRSLLRLRAIVQSARPALAMTTSLFQRTAESLAADDPDFAGVRWLSTDTGATSAGDWQPPDARHDTLAFLQYTSGSTTAPKGVMLTHANLLHNSELIRRCFEHTPASHGVIWLPPYHDMGLIGGVLQPLYAGFPVTLISPIDFLQRPLLWLQAISQTRATTSGGPNFAYDLCVRKITPEQRATLDLSSWNLAFNGAEPIRAATLERFAEAFGPCGFREEAFYPCYGLAESTLIVSGGRKGRPPLVQGFDSAALEQHRVVAAASARAQQLVGSGLAQPDHSVVIVDPERLARCAPREVGEIWVAGPSVAAGYWNLPAETADTFAARLTDSDAGPYLRTGDLGFLYQDQLFVTGRLKDLIIIRGRNHYPQDIEATVEQCHPALRAGNCAAFAVEVEGEERLVVAQELDRQHRRQDIEPALDTICEAMAAQHDLHPYAVVLLKPGSIPKTSSGKIQRHACRAAFLAGTLEAISTQVLADPSPEAVPGLTRANLLALPPQARPTALATYLREQAARLLNLAPERIEPQCPLNRLGLDSLLAAELQYSLEAELGVALPLVRFLEDATIAELAAHACDQLAAVAHPVRPLEEAPDVPHPLSYTQQSLWFMQQLAPGSRTTILACLARVRSPLDLPALQRALQALVDRHPALRTTFATERGKPLQRIHAHTSIAIELLDGSAWTGVELNERLLAAAYQPFDLGEGPLLRVQVCSCSADERYLLVALPHLVADFRSLAQLMHELGARYSAELRGQPEPAAPVLLGYTDYVRWEATMLAGPVGVGLETYWRAQLEGAPTALNLPTDHPRPAVQTYRGAALTFAIDQAHCRQLRMLSESTGATPYMILLAAFQTLLSRYTQQTDFLIGSPMAGRGRAEFADLIGPCARPIVLRARIDTDMTVAAFLEQTRRVVLDAIAHQDLPFTLLVERLQPIRDASRAPLFQVLFNFLSAPPAIEQGLLAYGLGLPGVQAQVGALTLESLPLTQPLDQFDLSLLVAEHAGELLGALHYNADLFEPATAARIAADYQQLLDRLVAQPQQPLAALLAAIPHLREPLVVAATFTAEPLAESLAFWSAQLHMPIAVRFAPYNQVFQQLLDPSSATLTNREGINLLLVRLEDWANLAHGWDAIEQNVHELLEALRAAVRQCPSTYLLGLCPASPAVERERGALLERAARLIADQAAGLHGVYLLDIAEAIARYQVREVHDPLTDDLGRIPFTPTFFTALGTAIARTIYALRHPPFKVIAVDCDQTLWSGICGEDGPGGIGLDEPRLALQRFLLEQRAEGMLLCLCTKNNEADVLATFAAHPDMPLRLEHFAACRINWRPKSDNLADLAHELELGLESFIFLDDSALECAEVQSRCPSVLALQLPEPAEAIATFLEHIWAFDKMRVTREDRQRAEAYAHNRQREELRAAAPTLADFLAALQLSVGLAPAIPSQLARVAELTQRTNQFNITTLRRTESQLAQMLAAGYECWVVEVRDRFGDYGLVGVILFATEEHDLVVDSFLLSCRALGRGVEQRMLAQLGQIAQARGCSHVVIPYTPTPKNQPARDFLDAIGAEPERRGEIVCYRLSSKEAEKLTYQLAASPSRRAPAADSWPDAPTNGRAGLNVVAQAQPLRRIALELSDADLILQALRRQKHASSWQERAIVAPRNPIEKVLAGIWCDLLGLAQVSVDDDFFALGGHSLLAVQMLSEIHAAFGTQLPLERLFVAKLCVADLAVMIADQQIEQIDTDRLAAMLDRVETLSDEELARLLVPG